MSDSTPEEKIDIEENNELQDVENNLDQNYLSRLKKCVVTHPLVSAFIFFIFTIVPILSFLGLPDTASKIRDAATKSFERHDITITPKFNDILQPNQKVTLGVKESQAKEKDCKVTKKQGKKDIVFTISCRGELGDPISFKISSTNCPDNSFGYKLGDTSDVEIYCP